MSSHAVQNKESAMTRRYGKFEVSVPLIENNPEEVSKIFEGLVMTRAEHLFHNDTIEYIAWSPHFRELNEGESAPEYIAEIARDDDGTITVKWRDVEMETEKEINTLAPLSSEVKTIIVNGVEIQTKLVFATYTDIAQIAEMPFRKDYTMTWSTKKEKGIMHHEGKLIQVTEGMIFNAMLTGAA